MHQIGGCAPPSPQHPASGLILNLESGIWFKPNIGIRFKVYPRNQFLPCLMLMKISKRVVMWCWLLFVTAQGLKNWEQSGLFLATPPPSFEDRQKLLEGISELPNFTCLYIYTVCWGREAISHFLHISYQDISTWFRFVPWDIHFWMKSPIYTL